jgi:phosphoglycerate-specific signal transduction histidine kinase
MKTRSKAKNILVKMSNDISIYNDDISIEKVLINEIIIDFDESSREWRKNKMYLGNGEFIYKK